MKLLILCTGNSCRSQMAEAFLTSLNNTLEVKSAGTQPASNIHPKAIQVMDEKGIDLQDHYPKDVKQFIDQSFDYVITVCDSANESCPAFTGKVDQRLHMGFEDPAEASGTETDVLETFRNVRDQIETEFKKFYEKNLT